MKTIIHNEEAKQINFLDDRFYTNDHVNFYPSVTTILDVYPKGFGFNQWLKDVGSNATQIADRAAAIGSKVHQATEELNNGKELCWVDSYGNENYTLHEWELILKFKRFWELCNPELIANEVSYCSDTLKYGGTLDRVVMIGGKRYLIDIKTSNYLHNSYELQLAAYAIMWNEKNPEFPIEDTGIVWLKASTRSEKIDIEKGIFQGEGWQLKTFDRHYTDSFEIFKCTQRIWELENPNYKPKNLIYPDTISL